MLHSTVEQHLHVCSLHLTMTLSSNICGDPDNTNMRRTAECIKDTAIACRPHVLQQPLLPLAGDKCHFRGVLRHNQFYCILHSARWALLEPGPGALAANGAAHKAVLFIGRRTSWDTGPDVTMEAHILRGFAWEFYGRCLRIFVSSYLRRNAHTCTVCEEHP